MVDVLKQSVKPSGICLREVDIQMQQEITISGMSERLGTLSHTTYSPVSRLVALNQKLFAVSMFSILENYRMDRGRRILVKWGRLVRFNQ